MLTTQARIKSRELILVELFAITPAVGSDADRPDFYLLHDMNKKTRGPP